MKKSNDVKKENNDSAEATRYNANDSAEATRYNANVDAVAAYHATYRNDANASAVLYY